jgi:hypothetical protein
MPIYDSCLAHRLALRPAPICADGGGDYSMRFASGQTRKNSPVNQLLARLTRRCDELGLHALNDDPQQDFRVTAFITTLVMNYLFTGKFKRTK